MVTEGDNVEGEADVPSSVAGDMEEEIALTQSNVDVAVMVSSDTTGDIVADTRV